jgi:hypothetical protein
MPLLGGYVGIDGAGITEQASSSIKEHDAFFSALTHEEMPRQIAYQLLRSSGIPRANFLSRVVPPSFARQAMIEFDDNVKHVLAKLAESELHPQSYSQASLSISAGGLGLRSMELVAPAAYLASFAQAIPDIAAISSSAATSTTRFKRQAQHCIAILKDQKVKVPTYQEMWEKYKANPPNKLQKEYVTQLESNIATQLLESDGTESIRARLQSASSKYATRWLTSYPLDKHTTLTNNQFSLSLRNLLSLPIRSDLPPKCVCDMAVDLKQDPHHPTACARVRKRAVITRHNRIVQEFAGLVREAGLSAQVEPRSDILQERKRCDVNFVCSQGLCMVDVSICQPTATSYRSSAAINAGSTARVREVLKHRHYDALAARERGKLYPLVMESFGFIGEEAQQLFRILAKEAALFGMVDEDAFYHRAITRMSFALQRGHAYAMMKSASMICGLS